MLTSEFFWLSILKKLWDLYRIVRYGTNHLPLENAFVDCWRFFAELLWPNNRTRLWHLQKKVSSHKVITNWVRWFFLSSTHERQEPYRIVSYRTFCQFWRSCETRFLFSDTSPTICTTSRLKADLIYRTVSELVPHTWRQTSRGEKICSKIREESVMALTEWILLVWLGWYSMAYGDSLTCISWYVFSSLVLKCKAWIGNASPNWAL